MATTILPRRAYLAIGTVLTHSRWHPIHRWLYRATGGRGIVGRAIGMDMILITTTGRRSGVERTVPLGVVADGPNWILIASNAGKERMPSWVHNLRADPRVLVEHRRSRGSFVARELHGAAYDEAWRTVSTAYPGYDVYRERTDRAIPLFVLEPAATGA